VSAGGDTRAATGWFEDRYRAAEDGGPLPGWADLRPNPNLLDWLAVANPPPGRAVVVGCGLGDDAAALAGMGFAVTAFDVAPTAVRRAAERFPAVPVTWRAADLFDLPAAWAGAFDLVVEIFTLQALPADLRPRAALGVASLVAPGGTLFMFCRGRDEDGPVPARPPWPLAPSELGVFDAAGFERLSFEDLADPHEDSRPRRFRAVWRRP
jgi:hypothetical protein